MVGKVLFGGLGCLLVLGALIIGGYILTTHFLPAMFGFEMPVELEEAAVLVGEGRFIKNVFLDDHRLGLVTDLRVIDSDGGEPPTLIVAGVEGVRSCGLDGTESSFVEFDGLLGKVVCVDVDGDGAYEFLDRGGAWQDVSLWNAAGEKLWSYGKMPGVNDMCPAGRDDSGEMQFAVGFNGGGGIRMLDSDAGELWKQSGANVWHVEAVDVDNDGVLEILHSNAAGDLTIRDLSGTRLRKAGTGGVYLSEFSICTWPCVDGTPHILAADGETLVVMDFNGRTTTSLSAPHNSGLGAAVGVCVDFAGDGSPYFAGLVNHHYWERSVLYIYDEAGELVYQEIFAEQGAGLVAISSESGQSLLVGGVGKVWSYRLQ